MTACSVMERRDHRLAASKNGWVELQNKFTSDKIWNYLKSRSFVFSSASDKTKTSLCEKTTAHLPLPLTSHLGQNVGLGDDDITQHA